MDETLSRKEGSYLISEEGRGLQALLNTAILKGAIQLSGEYGLRY